MLSHQIEAKREFKSCALYSDWLNPEIGPKLSGPKLSGPFRVYLLVPYFRIGPKNTKRDHSDPLEKTDQNTESDQNLELSYQLDELT